MSLMEDAWKSQFHISHHIHGHWLVIKNGEHFSYNMTFYKTRAGAIRGAKAAFNKINKEFEKILLVNE